MNLLSESEVVAQAAPYVTTRGVYFLVSDRIAPVLVAGRRVKAGGKQVMYVGQSSNIPARVRAHWTSTFQGKFDQAAWVEFDGTDKELADLEMRYIRKLNPPWNIYKGAKPKYLGKAGTPMARIHGYNNDDNPVFTACGLKAYDLTDRGELKEPPLLNITTETLGVTCRTCIKVWGCEHQSMWRQIWNGPDVLNNERKTKPKHLGRAG